MLLARRNPLIGFLAVLCLIVLPGTVLAEPSGAAPLRINTGFKKPVSDIYRLVIEDAFARIEQPVDFQEVSAERSLSLANDGIDDGDCCRIAELNRYYPNLVAVPVKVIDIDFMAFAREPVKITRWPDMAPYDVGVVRGWKILEKGLERHPGREVYVLSSPESLFGMLDSERIQVATIGRLVGYQTLADLGIRDVQAQEPPLVSRELFLQLHRKHAGLVPRLTRVLQEMSDEGTLNRYYRQVIDPLLGRLGQSPTPDTQD